MLLDGEEKRAGSLFEDFEPPFLAPKVRFAAAAAAGKGAAGAKGPAPCWRHSGPQCAPSLGGAPIIVQPARLPLLPRGQPSASGRVDCRAVPESCGVAEDRTT